MSNRLELAGESMEARLGKIADEFTDRVNRGERPDVEDYARRYPEMAALLRQVLPALQVMGSCPVLDESCQAQTAGDVALSGLLGDFRLIREVGRGGMGVVYEAEQISLRRRVALKVLPFAATMDPKYLQRFHNEAQAAACLHHTNIVPVFSVGCERSVHFYAMQFIDGHPLSDIIRQLCRLEKKPPTAEGEQTVAHQPSPGEAASTPPVAALTPLTGEGRRSRNYFRRVAELGIQAAEALDHAHQLGIVHRDIKPANLLLDGRGNVWVADFGLAQVQHGEASLTSTGQMVGTPRYMSPEQALAKRVPLDHRTDVYSLGVTLYEMLTLRPAFACEDRQELLHQIALDEPPRPRRLERSIPMELEIIVLKAMEKRPQDRYATAQELADDLRHWLDDRPIRARRPSWGQIARKWARRHRSAVRAASLLLCVLMLVAAVSALWWFKKQTAAETEARAALDEAVRWQQQERWSEALSAVLRAKGVLRGFVSDTALQQQVDELGKDLEMAQRLEKARLLSVEVKGRGFDAVGGIAAYRKAFAWYGLDVEHGDADATANFIRSRSIHMQLVAGLDFWLSHSPRSAERQEQIHHLLTVARAADPDEWRNRVRDAWERQDGKAINDLLASADVDKLLPTTMTLLGISLDKPENVYSEQAAMLLRRVQQRRPDDFWINHDLAMLLGQSQSRQLQEVIGFFRVAVALRPQSPGVHNNLGVVLDDNGQVDGAIAEYHEAIRLKSDYAGAHYNLGCALKIKGQFDEAIAHLREAIRLQKDFAEAHNSLAGALRKKGRPDEAVAEYREVIRIGTNFSEASKAHKTIGTILWENGQLDEAIAELGEAIRLNRDYPEAHNNLGLALSDKGRLDEAIDEYRQATASRKNFPEAHIAHNNLGNALRQKGQLEEAIAELRKAIRLKKDYAEAYSNLGLALIDKGRLDEAIAEFRLAIPLNKDYAEAHYGLGNALKFKGELDQAVAEYREAIRLKKDSFMAHNNLGTALARKGQLDEAVVEFRETIRLKSDDALAHFNLGCALEAKGQPDKAIEEYREAIRHKKVFAEAHVNLGSILAAKGQLDEAIAAFREAILHKKDLAEAHNNLGSALHEKGQPDAAIAAFREAIRLKKDYAEAHSNLKDALALKETLLKLATVLSGKAKTDNPAEQLALASVCQKPFKRLYAAAAKFYSDAFAAQPRLADDLSAQHRYTAACAAALAGCGQGADADKLDGKERARLRRQALDWLRADLKACRQVLEESAGKAGPAIARGMQHWLKDGDFTGVRSDEALAKLPKEERSAWRKLWADVAELLAKAQGKTPAVKKPNTKGQPGHHTGA